MARLAVQRLVQCRPYRCGGCAKQLAVTGRNSQSFSNSSRVRQGSVLELLEARGYVKEIAGDRNVLDKLLRTKRVGVYAGIDPTAPSLHLGHLLPLMLLFWLSLHGHHTVSLVGGATARVGDPSGRLTSRDKTDGPVQSANFRSLYKQVGEVWESASKYGQRHGYRPEAQGRRQLLDNADWLTKLDIVSFLQMLGTGMRIGTMLGRDTVKNKMERGDGMSFAEFTYPLLQGWDWWHMFNTSEVQLQVGGSDQYGNIIAGMDAIKHIAQNSPDGSKFLDASGKVKDDLAPMGITVPLLTTAKGEKFGKSAGNAVWLDKSMTSPFDLYGFLLRSSDEDVSRYLKLFTFVPLATINEILATHAADPGKRLAQHLLASEVLELVHGPEEAAKTRAEHQAMRNPSIASLVQQRASSATESEVSANSAAAQSKVLPRSLVADTSFARILYHAELAATKSEAARLIKSGGVYVAATPAQSGEELSFVPVTAGQKPESITSFVDDGLLVLRVGKWKVRVVEVVDDAMFEARGLTAPG